MHRVCVSQASHSSAATIYCSVDTMQRNVDHESKYQVVVRLQLEEVKTGEPRKR